MEALARLHGSRILLVEDDEINQEIAFELLSQNGMQVLVASNGQEALELLQQREFDMVLMDCQMPVMDGYQASRKIREQERFKSLPILAMSADETEDALTVAHASGMNDHISKPINISQMWGTMAKWIALNASH